MTFAFCCLIWIKREIGQAPIGSEAYLVGPSAKISAVCGDARADRDYFAFVNYTTLGYGDVTPVNAGICLGR